MKLRTQLLGYLLPVTLLGVVLLTADAYRTARQALLVQVAREAQGLGRQLVLELERPMDAARKAAEGLATHVALAPYIEPNAVRRELEATLQNNPGILGMAVALDPEATVLKAFAAYTFRKDGRFEHRSLAGDDYAYTRWDWFREPMTTGRSGWTDPYWDPAAQCPMITCTIPIHRAGKLLGVATADLALTHLHSVLESGPGGRVYTVCLINRTGRLLASGSHGQATGHAPETLGPLLDMLRQPGPDAREAPDPLTGQRAWVLEHPVLTGRIASGHPDWSLVLSAPTSDLLKPLQPLAWRMAGGAAALLALLAVLIHRITGTVLGPVQGLVRQADRFSRGAFQPPLPETAGALELRALSATFNRMGRDLVAQMEALRITTAQREGYQRELAIAAAFQQAILPRRFPPFPDLADRVDLHGLMHPAREVGGDFFDFLRRPDGSLLLVVGDVSDKGAPAALFMTQARLLVRLLASQPHDLAGILQQANQILAEEVADSQFVTVLLMAYVPETGTYTLASAGHPPPILLLPGQPPASLPPARSLPLAAWPTARYTQQTGTLPPGGGLVLYTDGLDEAMTVDQEAFGLERVFAVLADSGEAGSEAINQALVAALEAFRAEAPASDDLTVVTLRRSPVIQKV